MKLLLDTHVWLWALSDPSRLSRRVREELRNPENELWLSPVSTWEALLLNARGRIRLPGNLAEWLAQSTGPLREAPFTHEIVLVAQQLPLPHRDPADRFLAATAQVMDLTLVTGDDKLLGMGTVRTMKN
ncbi:MAG: type II toxin-antitoxin system VapC family toxin [Acidobacteriia bacterium]|nr:type II toxin-antitoxin system VapC family toxin [Terriglobia bacterium]